MAADAVPFLRERGEDEGRRSAAAPLVTRAPAKLNLTLHVRGRRSDGYHDLESLVAFAGAGDTLVLEPGPDLDLFVAGPTAGAAGPVEDNLVVRAARALASRVEGLGLGTFRLTKRLPAAAGIGGGSSDAAAALRLLARANGLPLTHPAVVEAAGATGADVPVCLNPCARMMRGVGDELGPRLPLPPLFAVLVNPGVPVATPAVFRALGLRAGEAHRAPAHPDLGAGLDRDGLLAALAPARNDLEGPAKTLAPAIAEALALLSATPGQRLARMSGSGATCFALYDTCAAAAAAARAIRRQRPGWWVKPTSLR